MHKKKLAFAAVLATTGIAHAQSSVTLYGAADAGIGKVSWGAPQGNDANGKIQFMSSSLMNNTGTHIGLRGIEDLGGGLRAGFSFETGVDMDNGNTITAGAGAGTWGRGAKMWVEGDWGTFQMGRTLNASFWGLANWELTGAAVYSVVGTAYNWVGNGPRSSSLFVYKTPNLGGFSADLGYSFKADNVVDGKQRGKWDMHAKYIGGPVVVAFSANQVKGAKTSYSLGGRYTFGEFTVAASLQDAANEQARRRGMSLGGKWVSGLVAVVLDVTRDFKNEWGPKKYTNALLEGKYALSKRTFVYAAYLRVDATDNFGLGVRHNF